MPNNQWTPIQGEAVHYACGRGGLTTGKVDGRDRSGGVV